MILNEGNFQENVLESSVPVLVDFWAPWCGPCNRLTPVLEQVAVEGEGKWVVGKVNTDENAELATKYHISSIPALFFFKNGEIVATMLGLQSKEAIVSKLQELSE